jgi:hypothetical protein
MITEILFNHIWGLCPQAPRIYRFTANGIIVLAAITHHAVGLTAENAGVWGSPPKADYRFFAYYT